MHDVIIDDTQNSFVATTQMEQRKEKLKKEVKPKRTEKLSQYLIDWLEKALIIASLISLNFLIYAGSGSYDMFSSISIFTPEVWYILVGIGIFSVIIIYLLSFFKLLQNLVVAAMVYYFVIAMFNQFAAFDKNAMLASLAATYISPDLGLLLTYVSHIVVALIIAFFAFLFVSFASKLNIFWMLLFLVFCNLTVIFTQMIDNTEHQKFNILKEEVINAKVKPGKKFIYIGLNGIGSYAYMDNIINALPQKSLEREDLEKTQDIILGFYEQNGFIFYPQTYVNYDEASRNFAKILNANSKKEENDYLLKNVYPESFWKFNRLNNKSTYLKESSLYNTFKKSKFNINAYQSSGTELCKINNEMAVHRCVERNSQPIDFDNMNISAAQKAEIILAEWLESTHIFTDFSWLYKAFRPFTDVNSLSMIGISYENIGIKNSADVLDVVVADLDKTSGNSAYFINIDLPQEMYIYDEFCHVKPTNEWKTKQDLPWINSINSADKRKAYAQQVRCVYGKLQNFIDKVNQKSLQKDTVIFIQGQSGLQGLEVPDREETFTDEFMNKKFVDSAVKDPLKKGFQLKTESCSTADILTQYLYRKKQCPEFDLNIESNLKEKILNQLHNYKIAPERMEAAQKTYADWYQNWQSQNGIRKEKKQEKTDKENIQKLEPEKDKSLPQTKEKNPDKESIPEKAIDNAPKITAPVEEAPEAQVEPISKVMESEPNTSAETEQVSNKKEEK